VSEQTEQKSSPTSPIVGTRRNLITQFEANTPEKNPINSHAETKQNSIKSSANFHRNSAEILEEFVSNRFSTPEPTLPTKTTEAKPSTKSHVSFFDIGDYADITFDKFVKDKNYGDGQSENTTSYMVFLEKSLSPNRKENVARRSESPQMERRQNRKGSNSLPRGARNLSDVSRMFDRTDSRNDQTNIKSRSFAEKMTMDSTKTPKSNELLLASGKTLEYRNLELGPNRESRSNSLLRNDRKTPDLTPNRQSRSPLRSPLAVNVTIPLERARNTLRSPNSSESSRYGSIHVEVKSDSSDAPTSPSNSQDSRRNRRLLTETVRPSSSLDNSPANSTPTKREITSPRLREARVNEGRYRSETSAHDIEVALQCAKQFEAMNARFNALGVRRDRTHSAASNDNRVRLETGVNKTELKCNGLAAQQTVNRERMDRILENRKPKPCSSDILLDQSLNNRSSSRNKGVAISPSSNSAIMNISTHRNTKNDPMSHSYDHQRQIKGVASQEQTPSQSPTKAQIESLKYSSAMQLNQSIDPKPTLYISSNELASKSLQYDVTPLSKQHEKLKERLHKSSSNPTARTINTSRATNLLLAAKRPSLHEQGAELQKQFTRWHQQLMESPEPAAKTNLRKSGSWNVGLTSSSNDRLYSTGRSYEQLDSIDESAQLEDVTPSNSRITGNFSVTTDRVDRRVSDPQLNSLTNGFDISHGGTYNVEESSMADLYRPQTDKKGVLLSAKSLDRHFDHSNTFDQPTSNQTDHRYICENYQIPNNFTTRFTTDSGQNTDKILDNQITRSTSNLTSIGQTYEPIVKPALKSILKKSIDRSFSSDDSVFSVPTSLKFSGMRNKNEQDNEVLAVNERTAVPNIYHRSLQGSLSTKEVGTRERNMENTLDDNTVYEGMKSNDTNLCRDEHLSKDNVRLTSEEVLGISKDRTQFSPPVSPLRKTSPMGSGVGGYAGATSKFSAVQNFQQMKALQSQKRRDNPP
jgi:hypothetical protein